MTKIVGTWESIPMADIDRNGVHIHNLDVTFRRVIGVGGGAPKYMMGILERAMREDVWPNWIREISLNDHTLEDLRNLGHPYSTRFGKDSFVHPDEQVHAQSGDLRAMSKIELHPSAMAVRLTNNSREYIYLRFGTSIMRMRDPGGAALRDSYVAIKERFQNEVRNAIFDVFTS